MELLNLKKLFIEHAFRPTKALGQNFLIDKNVRDNIIKHLNISEDDIVVEIGPGFGMMTFEIARICSKVIAVEKDSRICGIISPLFEKEENIELLNADILDVDYSQVAPAGQKIIVFGNIPYNITTGIIERIIEQKSCIKRSLFCGSI